ncbi:MAG: hypothetical protein N2662_08845, partial [Bacteroidales bacterium]|nr:hypothetical protein [Bacteroidales bacterium]
MKKYLLTLTLIFLSLYAKGEMTVSTLFTSNDIIRGITLDKEGNLYLALSRSEQSMPIVKFDKNTGDTSVIAYIPRTPKSLVFDQTGNLYIAAYGDIIYCLPKGSKNLVTYVSGIEDAKYGAAGMITDGDTLYFIQQNNHYIYKVLPGGGTVGDTTKIKPIQPIRYAFGSNVYVQDIEWLPDGNLLITTIDGNGPLYKYNIKTKTSTYLGQAPCNSIYDIIRINDSTYLIAGYEKHQIFSLTFNQSGNMNFTPIAGTGTGGYLDGSVSIARFSYPYGLCYNKSSNIIYVNDDYRKKIRIIKDCYPIDLNVQGISNCPYDTASLSATISDTSKVESYLWQGPNGFKAYTKDTSFILTPTLVGRYTFTVKDKLGCTHQQTTALANKVTYSSLNIRTSDSAYTSPSGKYVWTISGQYLDTLTNVYGCDSIITINLKFVRFEPASSYFVTTMSYRPSCVVQGIVFDSKGNMYFSERSSCNSLKKMDAMGNITNLANIPGDPTFLAIDKNDNIYISCYRDKKIVKYSTTSNTWTDYVTNIADSYGPSGIVVVDDTLYFLEYSYQRLFKVKPGGGSFGSSNVIPIQSQVYGITGSWASTVGMDVLPNGNFIVTTYYDEGKVYEVNRLTGASNVLLTLPDNDLVAVTHTPDKKYYVTGYNTNKIYRINADSLTYNAFAGNGNYGTIDGNSYEAEFQNPFGIGVDIEGTFYVSQYGNYALRKISPCNNIQISLSTDYKCINDSATIRARVNNWSQVASYKWIGPEGFLSFAKDTTFMLKHMYTGEYTFTVTDIKGCTHRAYTTIYNRNSLVHIYPRVNDSIYTSPSGKKYTKSGLYYDTLTNQYGCDSVIAIHLQIIKPIKDAIYSVSTIAWKSCDVWGITFDKEGNLYYAERHPCNVIKKMDVNGNISDYAYVSGDPVA